MPAHKLSSVVAYYVESVAAGTGPADWSDSGVRIDHTEADVSTISQDIQQDPRMEVSWARFGRNAPVLGLKSGQKATVTLLFTGSGDTPADGETATISSEAYLTGHCLGAVRAIPTKDVASGTTTTITVAAITGWTVGDFIAVQDLTTPAAVNTGKVYIRRITAISDNTATIDEALPFTPASGDLAIGCVTAYVDEQVLEDSTAALSRTLSWYFSKGGNTTAGDDEVWVLYGTAADLTLMDFGRSSQPKMQLSIQCGSWETSADVVKDNQSSSNGQAAKVIGKDTHVWIEDYGTTTSTKHCVASIEVATGVQRHMIETVTSPGLHMEGLCGYSAVGNQSTQVTMDITGYTDDWEADLQAATPKVCRYAHDGAPGSSWALHFSRCWVRETPTRSESGEVSSNKVVLESVQDEVNSNASVAALWESKICIVRA